MTEESCTVCFEAFNKSTRMPTECPYCHIKICRTCFQFYLLNDINDIPRCINPDCRQGWEREFIDGAATRTFRLQTYKEHREKVLSDRERSRLPETQEYAAAVKNARDIHAKSLVEIATLTRQIRELTEQLAVAESNKYRARRVIETWGQNRITSTETAAKRTIAEFIKPCPVTDCKGFLSTAWKCGMCEQWSCPECHELKGPSKDVAHTCDPDKVASARLIDRESKPCPRCGARICKIEGCDQMWCTACNTGFNWRTGTVADGPIHNPHYFEYLRRTGQAPVAAAQNMIVNCDHETDRLVSRALYPQQSAGYYTRRAVSDPNDAYLIEAWRLMREAQDPYGRHQGTNIEEEYRVARVKYMVGDLSEDDWKAALQRIEKDANFQRAKNAVRDLFAAATRDIIRQVLNPDANRADLVRQVGELITYCNESYDAISKRFGRKTHKIEVKVRA